MTETVKVETAKKPAAEKKAASKTAAVKKAPASTKSATSTKPAAEKKPAAKAEVKKTVATPKPTAKKAATGDKITKLKNVVYATGKRKNSVARVYLAPGKGAIVINDIELSEYFKRPVLQMILRQPCVVAKRDGQYDVRAFVSGGGLSGQAGAVKHGISKALCIIEPDLRKPLKDAGFLTRDARVVERKHFGFRKARRSTQFSKR